MSDRATADIEALLRQAFAPIEPPAELEARVEARLATIVELAADELEAWELSSFKDPRNWMRPVVAVVAGSTAAAGLVIVRTQQKRHRRRAQSDNVFQLAERTVRDVAHEARKLVSDADRRR